MTIEESLKDERWRIRNLYRIRNKSGLPVPFQPNAAQDQFLCNAHHRNLILKARQLGFSTLIGIWFLDQLLFNENQTAGIIDKTLPDAQNKLDRIRLAWKSIGEEAGGEIREHILSLVRLEESSRTRMVFSNGSSVHVGTSHRGGTLQYLHVSEFGHIAHHFPLKAREIFNGAVPSVADGNFIVFESTHEGGKSGRHYELITEAQRNSGRVEISATDWRFHFFPWWQEKAYRLDPKFVSPQEEHLRYFNELRRNYEIDLDDHQKAWWIARRRELRHDMLREYPSVPAEVFEAPVDGAIYGRILADLRAAGRVSEFQVERRYPVWTFWDIGQSDSTSIWAIQVRGQDILWVDWYENEDEPPGHYAGIMREWSDRYPIAGHFLPHDAGHRTATGVTVRQALEQSGLKNLVIVPRTTNVWNGINELRELLRRSWFHTRTARVPEAQGLERASGLAHLEAYRKHLVESGSILKDKPVHDEHSHTADAARTFAEAWSLGMVDSHFPQERKHSSSRAILANGGMW